MEVEPLTPRFLWIEVTDKCNSRCKGCNIWLNHHPKKGMTPDEVSGVFIHPFFKNVEYIINSGGEPTLREDLLDFLLAEHYAMPKATLQLSTNGLLPEKVVEVAKEMKKRNISFEVGVSLDGVGEDHDRIRGVKGNFKKVEQLTRVLKDMGVPVSLGATLTVETCKQNMEAKAYAERVGVPFLFHWFNRSTFYGNCGLGMRETVTLANAVAGLPASLYRDMWLKHLHGKKQGFRCYALNSFMVVKCNGDVAPCLTYWDKVTGNVFDGEQFWCSVKACETRDVTVKYCKGCLNNWGVIWSLRSMYYPLLWYKIKRVFRL